MDQNKTCIEMAFDLARSGKFTDLTLLERRLHDEGYSTAQLDGPSLRRQIRAVLAEAGKTKVPATHPLQKEQPMPMPKPDDETPAIDLEQDLGTRPTEAIETDSNDIPTADANGDSDNERADENQAVPDRS
jgi:hypothetical protein